MQIYFPEVAETHYKTYIEIISIFMLFENVNITDLFGVRNQKLYGNVKTPDSVLKHIFKMN